MNNYHWKLHTHITPRDTDALFPPELEFGKSDNFLYYKGTDQRYSETFVIKSISANLDLTPIWKNRPIGATHCLIGKVDQDKRSVDWFMHKNNKWFQFAQLYYGDKDYIWISVRDHMEFTLIPFPEITEVAIRYTIDDVSTASDKAKKTFVTCISLSKPNRHADIINHLQKENVFVNEINSEFGFMLDGKFLTRQEAMYHVLDIGQIRKGEYWDQDKYTSLHSEDLWPE